MLSKRRFAFHKRSQFFIRAVSARQLQDQTRRQLVYRPLQFYERSQRFIGADDKTLSVTIHVYEVRPRKDKRGVDPISDVLPFGRLWYDGPTTVVNATGYAKHFSRSLLHPSQHRVILPLLDIGSAHCAVSAGACPNICDTRRCPAGFLPMCPVARQALGFAQASAPRRRDASCRDPTG